MVPSILFLVFFAGLVEGAYNRQGFGVVHVPRNGTARKVTEMIGLDSRDLNVDEGVLVEDNPADGGTIWWLPDGDDDEFRYWVRVATTLPLRVAAGDGMHLAPARAGRFKQRREPASAENLSAKSGVVAVEPAVLPTGESVERCGQERTDLFLIRATGEQGRLNEERIRERWPAADAVREVGSGLFLVSGLPSADADGEKDAALLECPRARAEQLLSSARTAGNRRAEASVLTDLAVMSMNDGDSRHALDRLKEALAITRELADQNGEADVVGNFGILSLTLDDPGLASQLFERELAFARAGNDRFAEKTALEHLGLARSRLGDRLRALEFFDKALALARAAGDRQHETVLLWQQAVQYAEKGERAQAVALASSAVAVARRLDAPQADLLAAHLQRYSEGGETGLAPTTPERLAVIGASIVVGAATYGSEAPAQTASDNQGPGLLRKGLSAARSVTRFLTSGLKLTDSESLHKRLEACSACEHHTGLRCKVCGCFTNVKTRMAGETCPAGKWLA
jgi:tetratricopeptide (TPR) repeat protein